MSAPSLKYGVGNAASTTASISMTDSQTTTPLTSTTNFQAAPTPGEGMILIDEGAATEEIVYATGVSGGNLTTPLANRGLEGGSAQAHSSGVSIKGILTAGMWNDLITALVNTLFTQSTGALKSGITLTLPQINDTSSDHQYILGVSELTADRTVTLPLLTGNDDFVFEDHTQTLTNKRITPRVVTATSYTTDTGTSLNCDTTDRFIVTAQAGNLLFNNPTGTPTDGQTLWIAVTGTAARALTYGNQFEASAAVALPTTTVTTARLDIGFIWRADTSKWRCVASA